MAGSGFNKAFKRFVQLVEPIPQVRHVAGFADELEIHVFIERRDERVCSAVYKAEERIIDEFPNLEIDFWVRYLEGRPLAQFVNPPPKLFFERTREIAEPSGTSSASRS